MAAYVNERPTREQKRRGDSTQTERRLYQLLFLSFGMLFIIQAILNISLRLTLYSSKDSTQLNTTDFREKNQVKEEEEDCETKKPGQYNRLQDRLNALTRDKNLLENRNTELNNRIRNLEEEIRRLEMKLREQGGLGTRQCPAGWMRINSRCYFLSSERKTWTESRKYCQSKDADLVVINSEQEQRSLYRVGGDDELWIGLHEASGRSGWRWVDGSALTKSFWMSGQPNCSNFKMEDCVQMFPFDPVLANWHDIPCSMERRWLCEKNP